jgi:hypothetical protein
VSETPPPFENIDHQRVRERAYQTWAAQFEQKRRELECDGIDPSEAGFRILAEMGEFHFEASSLLRP